MLGIQLSISTIIKLVCISTCRYVYYEFVSTVSHINLNICVHSDIVTILFISWIKNVLGEEDWILYLIE